VHRTTGAITDSHAERIARHGCYEEMCEGQLTEALVEAV
jgi:hypothetical protein